MSKTKSIEVTKQDKINNESNQVTCYFLCQDNKDKAFLHWQCYMSWMHVSCTKFRI